MVTNTTLHFFVHSSVLALSQNKDISSKERMAFIDFIDFIPTSPIKAKITTQTITKFTEKFKDKNKVKEFMKRAEAFFDSVDDDSGREEMASMIFHALKIKNTENVFLLLKDDQQEENIRKLYDPATYPKLTTITIKQLSKILP